MTKLDEEINDLLTALQLEPRKAWPDENRMPSVAGRCAGSYGCGVQERTNLGEAIECNFIQDLSELLNVGVSIEHATAALARKYSDDELYVQSLSALVKVMRNPKSSKENFAMALIDIAEADPKTDNNVLEKLMKAIAEGNIDRL